MNYLYDQLKNNTNQNRVSNNPQLSQIVSMAKTFNGFSDKNAAIKMLETQYPQAASLAKQLSATGTDPKQLFFAKAKEMGVDPNTILNLFR